MGWHGFRQILIGSTVFLVFLGERAEARLDLVPGSRYTSGRAAALADAYLPLGDDVPSGLFYNPADLGRIRTSEIELLNLSFYGNSGYISMLDGSFYNVVNLSSYAQTLQSHPGKTAGVGGAYVASIGLPFLSFGVLMQSQLSGQFNTGGTITYRSLYELVPAAGTGFRMLNGLFRFGYSVQWVNKAVGGATVPNTGSVAYESRLAEGSGLSHTVGVSLAAPVHMLPTFDFVVRNAFGTRYTPVSLLAVSTSPTGAPPTEPMTFDASFALHPGLGQGVVMNLILVQRDLTGQSNTSYLGRFALGAEISMKERVFFRGGWGGGYPAAGIGFRRKGAELSFTWYTEEMGSSYLSQPDSRFMFQYQLRNF